MAQDSPCIDNPQLALAERYVNNTQVSLFLTGKAGTGKTTFLKHIVTHATKRCVVVAPTGVAAVGAGGATIHSFFQIAPSLFLPGVPELVNENSMRWKQDENGSAKGRTYTMRKSKMKLIRSLDLLIIDEISMVRADLLDAVDDTLRRVRRNDRPFGGVQLMMIGDVQQLPPVVTDAEAPLLHRVYPSAFFFHSKALQRIHYITIQLTRIYRQQDASFIALLNNVRDGCFNDDTLRLLNSRLIPGFEPQKEEDYIRLVTHNHQADRFNHTRLEALKGRLHTFPARITGNFPQGSMPTEQQLQLKVGAQVMFVKNDSSDHRYYNGKLGRVEAIDEDEGISIIDNDGNRIEVQREVWTNFRYELDEKSGEIEQKEDGSFTQYPLKLAWAITIHKAQGLTFDKVIIDAQAAFAYGQVYVALSRCRTLHGLVLTSPIGKKNVFDSHEIDNFNATLTPQEQAMSLLGDSEREYYFGVLEELFDCSSIRNAVGSVNRVFRNNLSRLYPTQTQTVEELVQHEVPRLTAVSDKFLRQLKSIKAQLAYEERMKQNLSQNGAEPSGGAAGNAEGSTLHEQEGTIDFLRERVKKGVAYFFEQTADQEEALLPLLNVEPDNQTVQKTIDTAKESVHDELTAKRFVLEQLRLRGFSVQHYNRAKVDFLLENKADDSSRKNISRKNARNSRTTNRGETLEATQVYGDVKYPRLASMLSQWRREKAEEANVKPYMVLQQKTLVAISNVLPITPEALGSINGMGKVKMQSYGPEIIQLVTSFCREQGIDDSRAQTLDFVVNKQPNPAATEEKVHTGGKAGR